MAYEIRCFLAELEMTMKVDVKFNERDLVVSFVTYCPHG